MKKTVIIVYKSDDWNKKTPLDKFPMTRTAFEDFYERGQKHGFDFYRASIKWLDEKRGVFLKAWTYRDKRWTRIKGEIKPDLIIDKIAGKHDYNMFSLKTELSKKTKIFNDPLFRTMLNNKLAQYLILGDYMPKSFLATNKNDLSRIAKKLKSVKIVLKPLYGSGGFGIIIAKKADALKKRVEFPVFVQEFLESRKGVPGFSKKKGLADLRMIFINHKFIYALSRIAKKNSLFTNFHQGARAVLVQKKYIPKSVKRLVKKIIDKLSVFHVAHYSLDFLFDDHGKPYLIEINTTPGFDLLQIVGTEKEKEKNLQEIINILK